MGDRAMRLVQHDKDALVVIQFVSTHWEGTCVTSVVGAAVSYLQRLLDRDDKIASPCLRTSLRNQLLVAVILASKWMDDEPFSNGIYARHFGISICKLNLLEAWM